MHRFEIWAPRATKMTLSMNGTRYPMSGPTDHGMWTLQVDNAQTGDEYGFLIDNDEKIYPDPRSQWQPRGVHGLSRIYDQGKFEWRDAGFQAVPLPSAVVYELHVGTFTEAGTLDAAIEKLDALKDLGITHIELMPVASFDGQFGWGYDGVDLYAVHEPYGGPDALKRFVDAAHCKGLGVLLDVVYNHFGPAGNYSGKFGPYILEAHQTPWGGAVNLEASGATEVRRFFCDNALMWLHDFHIDGLRLDAVHALVDRSAIHFLEQLAIEVETLAAVTGRNLVLIAESDLNDPRIVTAREAGGYGMEAQWSDDFHHALFTVLTGERQGYYADFGALSQLGKALEQVFIYDGSYSTYRQRHQGKAIGSLSRHRFLGYIQNHDQVGNRALGDRIHQIGGVEAAKIAAAVVLMSPFVPLIFQGEEWACSSPFQYFADHEEGLAKLVAEGRRREFAAFGWKSESIPDPASRETFERCKLNWQECTAPEHADMLTWYRKLIALRRSVACLNNGEAGNTRFAFDEEQEWFSFERGSILVCCNLGGLKHSFHLEEKHQLLLASSDRIHASTDSLSLPPRTIAILQK